MSESVEDAPRKRAESARIRNAFITRGLIAREGSERTGIYYSKEESLATLDAILAQYKPE